MKIIKRGEVKAKTKQMTCSDCDTIFEYEPQDVHSDQRDGNFVTCPVCKKLIATERREWQWDR